MLYLNSSLKTSKFFRRELHVSCRASIRAWTAFWLSGTISEEMHLKCVYSLSATTISSTGSFVKSLFLNIFRSSQASQGNEPCIQTIFSLWIDTTASYRTPSPLNLSENHFGLKGVGFRILQSVPSTNNWHFQSTFFP